ncbi:unnamed protein product, partial [marine sediment metagenome]
MNRIRFFRRQANITQEELGKVVGVNKMRIHRYETEKTRCPYEMREKIVTILGLPEELIFPEDTG